MHGLDDPFARRIVETTHEPLLVLDEGLRVRRVMRLNGRTLAREDGESRHVLLAIEDVTARKELDADVTRGELPRCRGNRDQLRRVLQNLVENALTYHGDAPPRVRISGEERKDGSAHVVVADRGPGTPEQLREKVFGIFQQLDPHGEGREGSGMGLALCRKIVERHGGDIWIESGPGEGSEFHFTLDLSPEET